MYGAFLYGSGFYGLGDYIEASLLLVYLDYYLTQDTTFTDYYET